MRRFTSRFLLLGLAVVAVIAIIRGVDGNAGAVVELKSLGAEDQPKHGAFTVSETAELEERIASTKAGSITSVQAVYVPADDMTDPAVSAIFAHLDTMVVLSRKQASKGIYPAVDPLASSSKLMDPIFLGERHYRVAQSVRGHLARYRELEDIIAMLGIEALSKEDRRTVVRARRLQRYLSQPFHVVSQHTGIAGASVPLEATLADCEAFLRGDHDETPEEECYMRGTMQEAKA